MGQLQSYYYCEKRNATYFLKMALIMAEPILRSSPLLVRGMPVFFEILRFTSEMPKARFQEKLTPGIFIGIEVVRF